MSNAVIVSMTSAKAKIKLDNSYDNIEIIYSTEESLKTSDLSKN